MAALLTGMLLFTSAGIYGAETGMGQKESKAESFTDVQPAHWAASPIADLVRREIVAGYGDGSFKPNQTLTYGEFIKMMVSACTEDEVTPAAKPNHWAENYYQKGLELRLYSENDIERALLDQQIPRKYMALIVSNAMGDEQKVEDYSKIEAAVKDVDSAVKYDYHIIKAYAEGILSGYTDGTFRPDGTLNRAESAVVLQRFLEPEKRTPVTAENPTNTAPIVEGSAVNRGTELDDIANSSPSTKSISEAISNYTAFPKMAHIQYYEIVPDYPEKMDVVLGKDKKREFIRMDWGNSGRAAALIKGGKCIDDMTDYGDGAISYYAWDREALGYKLPDFDYIGFYNSTGDTIILVPTPFKNGYTIAEQL